MDTLLIEVTNKKARGLLHELEERHLIRVSKEDTDAETKLAKKLTGKTAPGAAGKKANSVKTSGNEWWKDKEFVAELDRTHKAMESGAEKGVTLEELKISIEAIRLEMYGK